jgi:threonine dehydratase
VPESGKVDIRFSRDADSGESVVRIAGQILVTPFLEARVLSQITGTRVFVMFENLQFTASIHLQGGRMQALTG